MVITEGNERLKDGASVKIMGSEKTKKPPIKSGTDR
jgi:hypothetical protein